MDLISILQPYAHLVPDEYKKHSSKGRFFLTPEIEISMESVDRYGYSLNGLRVLRDHPSVPGGLQGELFCAVISLEEDDKVSNDSIFFHLQKKNNK